MNHAPTPHFQLFQLLMTLSHALRPLQVAVEPMARLAFQLERLRPRLGPDCSPCEREVRD